MGICCVVQGTQTGALPQGLEGWDVERDVRVVWEAGDIGVWKRTAKKQNGCLGRPYKQL